MIGGMPAFTRQQLRSAIMHVGQPSPERFIPDCLAINECWSREMEDSLYTRGLVTWDGHQHVLTGDGDAIRDRLVTGQDVPEEWWNDDRAGKWECYNKS
jgi:hypothetical protein